MPYNALWGVGRENRYIPSPVVVTNTTSNTSISSGASPSSATVTATIPGNTQITQFIVVANSLKRAQNPTNGRITIKIDGNTVASYPLAENQLAGDVIAPYNEIVPYSYNSPSSMTFDVVLSADNGGTTGTNATWDIQAVGFAY